MRHVQELLRNLPPLTKSTLTHFRKPTCHFPRHKYDSFHSTIGVALGKIQNTSSTSPDGMFNLHLRLLLHAIRALEDFCNFSFPHNKIPIAWKLARIVSNLKPNNSPRQLISYRPISLLSPTVKNIRVYFTRPKIT